MKGKIKELLQSEQLQQPEDAPHAFDDDAAEIRQTKSVKLTNENSIIKPTPPLPNIAENAKRIMASEEEQKKIAFDLTTRLLGMIKNKTLDENKDIKIRETEKQVLAEYANFARIINSDPNQEECMGTLSFLMAISRCVLLQRDRINELEYRVIQLQRKLEADIKSRQNPPENK